MPALAHTHKLVRTKLGDSYEIFKCSLENCTTYYPRSIVIGIKTICWVCGNEMTMKVYNLREKHPRHKECRNGRKVL